MIFRRENELVLKNADTGEVFASFPLADGRFSVTFTHSVNKSPYTDFYEIIDGEIYAVSAKFYSFGAGVGLWPFEGGVYEYGGDGSILASGEPIYVPRPVYIVGTFEDNLLEIGGEIFSLTEICGKSSAVEFSYE